MTNYVCMYVLLFLKYEAHSGLNRYLYEILL